MPERSRSPEGPRHLTGGPRHLVEGSVAPPWWQSIDRRHVVLALSLSFAALPVLVIDNLPQGTTTAEAIETTAPSSSELPATTSSTLAPSTTAAPTTVAPTTAPPTTAPPTTAPPTTLRVRAAAAPTTAPPTTAPPATAPPTTAPAPRQSAGEVEAAIRAAFPADAGDAAVEVARCESGLNPGARSPAGYRGLFQLSPGHASAFAQVTGRNFEDAWDEAGPNSQYAAHLWARSGWSPWGGCAP